MDIDRTISRRGLLAAAGLGIAGALAGCTGSPGSTPASSEGKAGSYEATKKSDPVEVRVASLKGPTSIGLVSFMDKAQNRPSSFDNTYSFTVSTAADEILPQLIKGGVDIALIPANAAATVYNKTKGAVTCLDINTLGVLSVVTGNASVTGFKDLAGKTVYLTGKGATPEYVMAYLLDAFGLTGSVGLEFKSEAAEVVSVLSSDPAAVGVLPQPFVTAALAKNPSLAAPVDLTDVWDSVVEADGGKSQLVTGVTVARDEFLKEHEPAVREFLLAQSASVKAVSSDPATAAPLAVKAGIIESEPIAAKAILGCHLVCITDEEMRDALSGYLKVLHAANPASVGGKLPGDDFYYQTVQQ